jgi:hypothetical protein
MNKSIGSFHSVKKRVTPIPILPTPSRAKMFGLLFSDAGYQKEGNTKNDGMAFSQQMFLMKS